MNASIEEFNGLNLVKITQTFKDRNNINVQSMSIKRAIALGNLLTSLELPIERENGQDKLGSKSG